MSKSVPRKEEDIKEIRIITEYPGINGWVVFVRYKDDKQASFSIDYGKEKEQDMLKHSFESIVRQLKSVQP